MLAHLLQYVKGLTVPTVRVLLPDMGQPKCVKEWFANKELFTSELAKGRKWQLFVADRIRDLGYEAIVPDSVPYE